MNEALAPALQICFALPIGLQACALGDHHAALNNPLRAAGLKAAMHEGPGPALLDSIDERQQVQHICCLPASAAEGRACLLIDPICSPGRLICVTRVTYTMLRWTNCKSNCISLSLCFLISPDGKGAHDPENPGSCLGCCLMQRINIRLSVQRSSSTSASLLDTIGQQCRAGGQVSCAAAVSS